MGRRTKTIYTQVKSLVQRARRYGTSKRDDPPELRRVSIYQHNTYDKIWSVGMSFARWIADKKGLRTQMVKITSSDVDGYVRYRKELYDKGEITASTLQADVSALKKIEAMVNHRYGRVDWGIPVERGGRRDKWGIPRKERGKNAPQRGPAYTARQAERIVREVEARCGRLAADALRFCRATGCRLESLVDLGEKGVRASRINIKEGTVTLLEKGGKWRTVKYDPAYQNFMERIVEDARAKGLDGPIFTGLGREKSAAGAPGADKLTAEQMWEEKKKAARYLHRAVKEAAEKEGFTGRGLHGFRKEFAVKRHAEYLREVQSLVQRKDWRGLSERFDMSEQRARDIVKGWTKAGKDAGERRRVSRAMDNAARLRLSKDLGHNRLDVTFAYVPGKNK
ncbi:MAG: hypothetical protein HPY89_06065 [Pelotomaculum sp.]|nr:hypothetical protein [Pelotomaculum sp.]